MLTNVGWWREILRAQLSLSVKSWTGLEFQRQFIHAASSGFSLGIDVLCKNSGRHQSVEPLTGDPDISIEMSAMQVAAAEGRPGALNVLISNGIPVEVNHPPYSNTPLWLAVHSRSHAAVELLLNAGAAIDSSSSSESRTALFGAIIPVALVKDTDHRDYETLRFLLEKGADPNARDARHYRLLHYAAGSGMEQAIEVLLEFGALIEDPDDDVTPLMMACEGHHPNVVRALLRRGACVDRCDCQDEAALTRLTQRFRTNTWDDTESIRALLAYHSDVNDNRSGKTPLFYAVEREDPWLMRILLRAGATLERVDGRRSALEVVCAEYLDDREQCFEMLLLLLDFGANPNPTGEGCESEPPLHQIATTGTVNFEQRRVLMSLLLRCGADVGLQNRAGFTALAAVSYCGDLGVRERISVGSLLLDYGASLDSAMAAELRMELAARSQR